MSEAVATERAVPSIRINSARIDDELRPREREIARELLGAHRSSLYYG